MQGKVFPESSRTFADHPKFAGVKIAVLVRGTDSDVISVSELEIEPGIEIPVHAHETQSDSIYVLSGHGEAHINGAWQRIGPGDYLLAPAHAKHGVRNTGALPLRLFVHHSPPLL